MFRASILVVAGVLFGIVASRASDTGVSWLLDLVSWAAIYIAILVVLIWTSPSARIAATAVVAVFIPFVIAYYGTMLASFGTFPRKYALLDRGPSPVCVPRSHL
jgi:F0F1-type ATP synthase membrane subunit a